MYENMSQKIIAKKEGIKIFSLTYENGQKLSAKKFFSFKSQI